MYCPSHLDLPFSSVQRSAGFDSKMSNAAGKQTEPQAEQAAPSRPETSIFQQMAELQAQRRALMEEDGEEETPEQAGAARVQAKALEANDASLLKVCVATNSRELNKCKSTTIRSWAKVAGMKGLSQLGKPALVRRVALFRSFSDVQELVSAFSIAIWEQNRVCLNDASRVG